MTGDAPLYESRVVLQPAKPEALAAILAPVMLDSKVQYAHRMIWTLFANGKQEERNGLFLYVVEGYRPFTAIVRSRRPPIDGIGAWTIDTHPFAPRLSAGQRLRFRLRAVATRWQPQPGADRGKRQDVMMTAWKLLPEAERTPERIERAALDWLAAQGAKHGFAVAVAGGGENTCEVDVLAYDRERFPPGDRKHRQGKPITFGAITYEGVLTVTAVNAFRQALAAGLGAGRAFGNGLLQIAPAPS